ncbi:MAG TPA: hypothetical protein PKC21_07845 [Oligoflexia bacterium]|nr:hypothetical protein [Oligoflexia bacterium]HMR25250.1 hypothetical protein [Oligoflexia bacterium]
MKVIKFLLVSLLFFMQHSYAQEKYPTFEMITGKMYHFGVHQSVFINTYLKDYPELRTDFELMMVNLEKCGQEFDSEFCKDEFFQRIFYELFNLYKDETYQKELRILYDTASLVGATPFIYIKNISSDLSKQVKGRCVLALEIIFQNVVLMGKFNNFDKMTMEDVTKLSLRQQERHLDDWIQQIEKSCGKNIFSKEELKKN